MTPLIGVVLPQFSIEKAMSWLKCFCLEWVAYFSEVCYPFSHNHGSVENYPLNERKLLFLRNARYSLKHDYGRKGISFELWQFQVFAC